MYVGNVLLWTGCYPVSIFFTGAAAVTLFVVRNSQARDVRAAVCTHVCDVWEVRTVVKFAAALGASFAGAGDWASRTSRGNSARMILFDAGSFATASFMFRSVRCPVVSVDPFRLCMPPPCRCHSIFRSGPLWLFVVLTVGSGVSQVNFG